MSTRLKLASTSALCRFVGKENRRRFVVIRTCHVGSMMITMKGEGVE